MARPAGALRRLEEYAPAVQRLGQAGVWERVLEHLAADGNNQYAMIDSTIVQAHQHSAGALKKVED
jgi:transposase